ncbi:unnamed protein product, partial [Closterium sp. Yama58-4]
GGGGEGRNGWRRGRGEGEGKGGKGKAGSTGEDGDESEDEETEEEEEETRRVVRGRREARGGSGWGKKRGPEEEAVRGKKKGGEEEEETGSDEEREEKGDGKRGMGRDAEDDESGGRHGEVRESGSGERSGEHESNTRNGFSSYAAAAHGDTAHGDTAHGDTAHGDTAHGDTAQGQREGDPSYGQAQEQQGSEFGSGSGVGRESEFGREQGEEGTDLGSAQGGCKGDTRAQAVADGFREAAGRFVPMLPVEQVKRVEEAARKFAKDGTIIFAAASYVYLPLFRNWVTALNRIGLGSNFLLFALDQAMHVAVEDAYPGHAMWLEVANLTQQPAPRPTAFHHLGSPEFLLLAARRPFFVQALLKAGVNALYSDLDTVWLKNPLPSFPPSLDITFQDDSHLFSQENPPPSPSLPPPLPPLLPFLSRHPSPVVANRSSLPVPGNVPPNQGHRGCGGGLGAENGNSRLHLPRA